MGDDSAARFTKISKSYDGRTLVVRDLDLDVRRGEFLTLLGPSGSGKTTCLLMLAGFETPTSGEILIDRKPVTSLPPHRRDIGMVFQNYALFPHLSVADNIAFPLSVRKRPRGEIADRVARTLATVKLAGFGARRPSELSGGQQQRVALARALIFEPQLILLDEPLGALDKQLREEMQYELKQLHRAVGITMIYVTHDQDEAMTMSDRVAVFHAGRIQQLADPRALYEEPANAFVAGFVGDNNALFGRVERVEGPCCKIRLGNGMALTCRAAGALASGDRAVVSIRPERIVIGDASQRCPNTVTARIEDMSYLGDHVRLRLAAAGALEFAVKLSDRTTVAGLRRGDTAHLGWAVDDARAYPERFKDEPV
jgi:putative spermidine/putrescine transport system ATP-binding protein